MKKLIVAESAGFCFGVKRSVDMALKLLDEHGSCVSLGELIHNEDVIRFLKGKGMRIADVPEDVQQGERVLVRAHGAAPEIYERLEQEMEVGDGG